VFILAIAGEVSAQLNPMGVQYFQNQYLANPAMVGINDGLTLNGGLRQQWSSIPGAPVSRTFSADYRVKEKVGIGMKLYNEETGLIERTLVMGSYAYRLPLGEAQALHFGLSLGFSSERVAQENINGESGDITVARFNERETFIDGDFGIAYVNDRLNVQAAIPNMKNYFSTDENNTVNRSTFFSSISYKWPFGSGMNLGTIEPKVVYRGVKGNNNLLDLGANLSMINNQLIFTGLYHSSNSATFGLGINYNKALTILGMYTTETAALRGYASGNFEVGLTYQFLKKSSRD
jgi:type IX secretion system PorP/SprF family membrane protein